MPPKAYFLTSIFLVCARVNLSFHQCIVSYKYNSWIILLLYLFSWIQLDSASYVYSNLACQSLHCSSLKCYIFIFEYLAVNLIICLGFGCSLIIYFLIKCSYWHSACRLLPSQILGVSLPNSVIIIGYHRLDWLSPNFLSY